MTYEAKEAVRQIHEQNWRLLTAISELTDKSLKAFRQLLEDKRIEYAKFPGDTSLVALYGGFAAVADGELASRARWSNSRGTWYAVVTIFREVSKHTSKTAAEFYKKCNGRKAAVEVTRELLAQHAAKFDVGVTVEADTFPDGEWAPTGGALEVL